MSTLLTTPRLLVRRFVPTDLDFVAEMRGDAEVMRFWPNPFTREKSQSWLERHIAGYGPDGHGSWLVASQKTGSPLGHIGLLRQNVDGTDETELGWMIHRPYWRRGYATEVARAMRDHAFDTLGRQRIISLIRPANIPSLRVAIKLGMKPENMTMHATFESLVFSIRQEQRDTRTA